MANMTEFSTFQRRLQEQHFSRLRIQCSPRSETSATGPETRPRTSIAFRVRHYSRTKPRCCELFDGALHPIGLAIALLRANPVVVGRLRLEPLHAHAEHRVWMALVQPDWRFRRLAEVLGIRTVVHDSVMHVRPTRVVGCPPDNGQMVRGQLELWPFGDLDALGSLGRRKYLSGGRVGREQAAHRGCDRQCQKQFIHGQTPITCSLGKTMQDAWRSRTRPPLRLCLARLVCLASAV